MSCIVADDELSKFMAAIEKFHLMGANPCSQAFPGDWDANNDT